MSPRPLRHLLLATALLAPLGAAAQDAAVGQLSLHGYLTQAWAVSKGARHYGMTDEPTTDYRYAALQLRYDREQHGILLQFNHRRLGDSPINDYTSDVTLNWAFYERRFAETGSLRLGRIPVPRGIYNEQRSIGVLHPLYRAPVLFYDEGAYYSETVDGVVGRYGFFAERPWQLEVSLYAGGWSQLIYDQTVEPYALTNTRFERAFGTQLWLQTPIDGLRLGASAQQYTEDGDADVPDNTTREFQASVDFTRSRGFVRSEYQELHYPWDRYHSGYLQAGLRPTGGRLMLVGEYGRAVDRDQTYTDRWPADIEWHRSVGAGVNWTFTPTLVGKLEHHWDRGVQVEEHVPDATRAPRFRYIIASVSASF
ncbi:MAG TPA: hypothetical protein VEA99_07530 [Gemmatimonadaceae bacterium]|nr:hypothetical protein [Gemmatimonadaceae bacterium]